MIPASAWVMIAPGSGSLVISATSLWLHYSGGSKRSVDQLLGDIVTTRPMIKDALVALRKVHPDENVIGELEKRYSEAEYNFTEKVLGPNVNERAKKVYYKDHIDVLFGILQDVNNAEMVANQKRVSEESFDSARIQTQGQDEGMELQDLGKTSSKSV